MHSRHRGRRGFMTGRLVFSLAVCLMMMPLTVTAMKVIGRQLVFREEVQDEIALAQLRRILITGDDYVCSRQEVTFLYHSATVRLYTVNRRVILTPGTQIFLSDIDSAYFYLDNGLLYISYSRMDRTYERVLIHV